MKRQNEFEVQLKDISKLHPSCQGSRVSGMMSDILNMELTSPSLNTLKINSKKGYILVDPDTSEDAKVVILSDNSTKDIQQTPENLVIYGPGDFEASGILIKGTRSENETMYSIDTDEGKALVVLSTSISKLADEDDYDAVIVKAVDTVDEAALSALSSKLVVVYGDASFVPDAIKVNTATKLNLKKTEELTSNVVYLEKK